MVLQLDNLEGTEAFQPDWATHVPVIHRYGPNIERWRTEVEAQMPESLRRSKNAAHLVDTYLWTMAGENAAGDPTAVHDSGNGYGLMADRVSRTPPGTPPAQQIRNGWNLVQANGWRDWGGDGNKYDFGDGKGPSNFGALGVIAPYDPDPNVRHPLSNPDGGPVSSIKPPSVGDEGLMQPTVRPAGWEPPTGYLGSGNVGKPLTVVDRLRNQRAARVQGLVDPDTGDVVQGDDSVNGRVFGTIFRTLNEQETPQEKVERIAGKTRSPLRSTFDQGLKAASDAFNYADEGLASLGIRIPTRLPTPGGGQETHGGVLKQFITPVPELETVQRVVGDAAAKVTPDIPLLPTSVATPGGGQASSVGAKDVSREVGKAFVPTTPAEVILQVLTAGGGAEALTGLPIDEALSGLGRKAYSEVAVRAATSRRFAENAPDALFRHERAGANIAADAAGLSRYETKAARDARALTAEGWARYNATHPEVAAEAARIQSELRGLPEEGYGAAVGSSAFRDRGATAAREYGAEVAGGAARSADYDAVVRAQHLMKEGEAKTVAMDKKLADMGVSWADYGEALGAFKPATPTWEREPHSSSVRQGVPADAFNPDGSVNIESLKREMRRAVADVRAERAGKDARTEMRAAQQRLRGAQTGREAGDEVGGGAALPKGEGPGRGTGRPKDAQSDEAWAERIRVAADKADGGEKHRFWYDNSSRSIIGMAHGDMHDADLIARAFAAGSNKINVSGQGQTFLQGWQQFKAGEKVTKGAHMAGVSERVDAALRMSDEEWDAYVIKQIQKGQNQKTTNFWLDMMDDIDPERAARIRAESGATLTVDAHMMRAFGYGDKYSSPTAAQYREIAAAVSKIAAERGWTPKQAQAAIWVQQIADFAKQQGKKLPPNFEYDYGDAVAQHAGRLRNEYFPAPNSPRYEVVGEAVKNAPPIALAEYARALDTAMRDEQGYDIAAKLVNLPVEPVHGNPVISGTVSQGPARGLANAEQADVLDQYAMIRAAMLQQDEVMWYRPFNLKSAGFHNGTRVDFGRQVTQADVEALRNELADTGAVFSNEGNHVLVMMPPDEANYAARAAASDAVPKAVVDSNKTFRERVGKAVNDSALFGAEQPVIVETFATDGRRFALDGTHQLQASTLGRPDVREAIDAVFERRHAVDDAFAAEWDPRTGSAATRAGGAGSGAQPSSAAVREAGARQGNAAGDQVGGGSWQPGGRRPRGEDPQQDALADRARVSGEAQAASGVVSSRPGLENVKPVMGSEMLERSGRQIVVADMPDGSKQAFYRSTGTSVSADGTTKPTGEWVPFFGFAENGAFNGNQTLPPGWFIKTRGTTPELTAMTERLNAEFGPDAVLPPMKKLEKSADLQAFNQEVFGTRFGDSDAVIAQLDNARKVMSGNNVRRQGAEQGRMLGPEVSGGSAGVTPTPKPPRGDMFTDAAAAEVAARKPITPEEQRAIDIADLAAKNASDVAKRRADIDRMMSDPDFRRTETARLRAGLVGPKPAAAVPVPDPADAVAVADRVADVLPERMSNWAKVMREIGGLAGAPRTLMTAGPWDFSAILRNNPILGARHPGKFKETLLTTLKAYGSEDVARAAKEGVESSPYFESAKEHGVKFWDWGAGLEGSERVPGYEGLNDSVVSQWVEKIPWIKGSERAMAIAQNVMGMRVWEEWAPRIIDNVKLTDAQKRARLTDLAAVINHSRGFSGSSTAEFLSKLNAFFSAQYTVSRPQALIDPLVMALRGSPEAAQLAGQSLMSWAGGNAMLLGILGASGAAAGGAWSVNFNPLDSDFGQLKIGDTRYDTLAGFGPLIKLVTRSGAVASDGMFGTDFARDRDMIGSLVMSYFENKEHPVARAITDVLQYNKLPQVLPTTKDGKLDLGMLSWVAPMIASGIVETAWNEDGYFKAQAIPTAILNTFGGGSSTYRNQKDEADHAAKDLYGRSFDDLSPDERLAAIAKTPERAQRRLKADERKKFQRDRNKEGWRNYWNEEENDEFYRQRPQLAVQAWALDKRPFVSAEAADRALALNIEDNPVKFKGLDRAINADDNAKKAWEESKDIIEWYYNEVADPDSMQATARRMYKKDLKDLTRDQRSQVKSNIRELARQKDVEADAWLYWWGGVNKPKTGTAAGIIDRLEREYGLGAGLPRGVGDKVGDLLSPRRK